MSANAERMDDRTFYFYAHPLRRRRFYLALVFATLLFPLIAFGLIAGTIFLLVPFIALLLWLSARVLFAKFMGNMVLVSNLNYPRIHAIAEELKVTLGYEKPVYVFVYESENFNAYLSHLFFRRAIFLNSEIVEAGVSDDEVRWLVGRFVGYLRARRQAGVLGWLIRAAQYLLIFNLFLLPYERAMVFTGDRLAMAAIKGDVSSAVSALQKLFVGRQLGYSLNPEGIIEQQRRIKGSFFAFLARLPTGFPHMTTRYVDLMVFAKAYFPSQYARFVAANPGIPEDLPRLVPLAEHTTPVLDERTEVKSGMGPGWGFTAGTLAAIALVVIRAWPSVAAEMGRGASFDSSYPTDASAAYGTTFPDSSGSSQAVDNTLPAEPPAPEPAVAARTPVQLDPDRPIVFDDFYPVESKSLGEQGRCVVRMTVMTDGSITAASIETSSGYERLDHACLESIDGQYVIPATENGVPVEQTVLMPIEWKLT